MTESEPIDFFVYADQAAFYDALGPGTRENVGGEAHPDIRTMFALIGPGDVTTAWVGIVIPHELTHLVFDTAVGNPYHFPPRWLNEGVADVPLRGVHGVGSQRRRSAAATTGAHAAAALGGQFPTTAERFCLAYAESVSAVDFLVREHGTDAARLADQQLRRRGHRRRGVHGGGRPRRRRLRGAPGSTTSGARRPDGPHGAAGPPRRDGARAGAPDRTPRRPAPPAAARRRCRPLADSRPAAPVASAGVGSSPMPPASPRGAGRSRSSSSPAPVRRLAAGARRVARASRPPADGPPPGAGDRA